MLFFFVDKALFGETLPSARGSKSDEGSFRQGYSLLLELLAGALVAGAEVLVAALLLASVVLAELSAGFDALPEPDLPAPLPLPA